MNTSIACSVFSMGYSVARALRRALMLALPLAGTACFSTALAAYPDSTVTVVVPYGPGGGADTLARLYADRLASALGATFLVQNKPGAGGTLAAADAARAAPDGYTLFVAPTAILAITPHARQVNYAPLTDFQPVSLLATGMDVIVSSKTLPTRDLGEFIALAKANPKAYSFASSGTGTWGHMQGEVFKQIAGIDLLHVPYKSSNEYLTDLIQGRVSLGVDPVLLNQVQGDQLHLMAFMADKRTPEFPEVTATGEIGLDMTPAQNRLWYGLFAPAGTPDAIVQTLARAVQAAAQDPALRQQLSVTGIRASSMEPAAFAAKIRADSAYYADLMKKLGIKLD